MVGWPTLIYGKTSIVYDAYAASDPRATRALWTISLIGGKPRKVAAINATHPSMSPDGRHVLVRLLGIPGIRGALRIVSLRRP